MITFSDNLRMTHDDLCKAASAAFSSIMTVLPKEFRRMDVVKAVMTEGAKLLDSLPIPDEKE